jgi:hypothetical protein
VKTRIDEPPSDRKRALDELRAIRLELVALRRLLDEFAAAFLNAQYKFGQPDDRWRRRP